MTNRFESERLFLIRMKDGTRRVSESGPKEEEISLFSVLVVKHPNGIGDVRLLSSGDRIYPFDLKGRSVSEVAHSLMKDEETKYGATHA